MPFVVATCVAAALVLAAPFIGEIRRAILLRFPGQFPRIVGGAVLFAVAAAVIAAVARIRTRRTARYALLATSLIAAGTYAYVTRTGEPQVDAVERFHFVEYGLVTLLFYRAWRPAGDLSALVLPVLAGLLVGTVEEWFQWFIPARVGDVRDVLLNGVAIGCGLLFSLAVMPPARMTLTITPASWRRIGLVGAAAVLVFAAFFDSVHVGYRVSGGAWSFRSCYTAAALDRAAYDRTRRWHGTFVGRPPRLSAEDQYMTEGLWHAQRRNRAWDAHDAATAWHENLILERYFAPVLDTPSYVSATGHRWPAEQRAEAQRRLGAAGGGYESDAHPSAVHVWRRDLYWTVVSGIGLVLAVPAAMARRARSAAGSKGSDRSIRTA